MKQFSLDEYYKNSTRKIITRTGRSARIICTDAKGKYPIIALVTTRNGDETSFEFTKDGLWNENCESSLDLFFATIKREGWVNVYGGKNDKRILGCLFSSEEEAIKHKLNEYTSNYIKTIKIEWEE